MTTSSFRQNLEQAFRETRHRPEEERVEAVAAVLRARGLLRKADRGWARSRLGPVVQAIWERSLEDPGLAALMSCEWFENSLGMDLVARGVLEGDEPALALFQSVSAARAAAPFAPR